MTDFSSRNAFSGGVVLNNDILVPENIITNALTAETLHIGLGNTITVGSGTQNIGVTVGLLYSVMLIRGHASVMPILRQPNLVENGQIQITDRSSFEKSPQYLDTTLPLLQQDKGNISVQLAGRMGTVTRSGDKLVLMDKTVMLF